MASSFEANTGGSILTGAAVTTERRDSETMEKPNRMLGDMEELDRILEDLDEIASNGMPVIRETLRQEGVEEVK